MLTSPASGARAKARCDALGVAPYSDTAQGLYRGFLTPAHRATLDALSGWMSEAGMQVRLDPAANLIARYEGEKPGAPAFLIGSHIDSVRDAGRYDGPLGVMLGIECVAALHVEERRLPFAIEVIAFGDEEGSRFPASMLGSRALAGILDPDALDMRDGDGVHLSAALEAFGLKAAAFVDAGRSSGSVIGYLEPHIEQGPALEAEGLAVGVVTGIAAQRRFQLTVTGRAGHAGTTTMPLRADALAAAAECVLAAERIARTAAPDLVATVGRMAVAPGAANVIPGRVEFSLDVRAGGDDRRDETCADMLNAFDAVGMSRGVSIVAEPVQALPASPCDPRLNDRLAAAVAAEGLPVRRLVSGAGHDAMVMAALCPTAMLFIRCKDGISHNPAESVDDADVEVAFSVMRRFIDSLAADHAG